MALAETAKLVASLELKDKFTPAANKAMASLGRLESSAFRVGQNIGKGFQNAAANIAKIGLVVGAGLAIAVRGGIGHLVELENATTSVDGAIKQMGLTGQVSSAQVATWANDIERNIGAAFDDKEIVAATATLLRFGKVTPSNLRPAMQVITDLAVKTGSVDSAASLLAKALADPTKAAGKLSRQGVILTKVQQDQIKAFVKAGKTAQAQKVILDALTVTTQGAAAASQGPYARALSILKDVTEDAQKALATGFLPVLEKVAGLLSTELAKPETLNNIRTFGEGLAGGLDKLIDIARGLPWATIGASLKLAGQGAKTVLDMFTAMPPWVQTAILTGWGLNKLTGGALGGIVKELAGGLIKGVLGINAGAVSVKAGVVTVTGAAGGVPGAPVGPVTPGAKPGLLGNLLKLLGVGVVAQLASEFSPEISGFGRDLRKQLVGENFPKLEIGDLEWPFGPKNTPKILPEIFGGNGLLGGRPAPVGGRAPSDPKPGVGQFTPAVLRDSFDRSVVPVVGAVKGLKGDLGSVKSSVAAVGTAVGAAAVKTALATQVGAIAMSLGTSAAAIMTASAATGAGQLAYSGSISAGNGVEAAIRASRPIITTNVQISATSVVKTNTVIKRYGNTGGDRDGGNVGVHGR